MAALPPELAPPEAMPNCETVELFSYFLREFKGFMTHMDAALQVRLLSVTTCRCLHTSKRLQRFISRPLPLDRMPRPTRMHL